MIKKSGRNFGSYLDRLIWPLRQLMLYLKDRKPAINITDENVSALTDRCSSVYDVRADNTAEQPPDALLVGQATPVRAETWTVRSASKACAILPRIGSVGIVPPASKRATADCVIPASDASSA